MIKFLVECILFFIPRYVTDRVALVLGEDGSWSVYCLEHQVDEHEKVMIDAYGTIRAFTWFGYSAGGKVKLDKSYNPNN